MHNEEKSRTALLYRGLYKCPIYVQQEKLKNKGRAVRGHAIFACRVQAQGSVVRGCGGVNWRRTQLVERATGARLSLLLAHGSGVRAAARSARRRTTRAHTTNCGRRRAGCCRGNLQGVAVGALLLAQHQNLYKILISQLARTSAQPLLAALCVAEVLSQFLFLVAKLRLFFLQLRDRCGERIPRQGAADGAGSFRQTLHQCRWFCDRGSGCRCTQ